MSPTDPPPCACGCGRPRDRPGQNYRRDCHAAYMRGWRAHKKRELAALKQRLRELEERNQSR